MSGSYWAEKKLEELETSYDDFSQVKEEAVMSEVISYGKVFLDTEQRKENARYILDDYEKVNWPQRVSLWKMLIDATSF